jgi:mono/diheme cytochrome c family protein
MSTLISRFGLPIALGAALIPVIAIPASSAAGPSHKEDPPAAQKKTADHGTPATAQSVGEQKFNQNCARCHRTPEGFSPRISGTILKHMRVRASLSPQDERDILHFLNP